MRTPNYKVGWLIPGKVAALTHFHAEITQEDMAGVITETMALLKDVKDPFHIIIDNRVAPLDMIYTLEDLQKVSAVLNHPLLAYVVIVKPDHLELGKEEMTVQSAGNVHLKNVSSIQEAAGFLCTQGADPEIDLAFFG
jgi:hypothetical protein